MSLERTYLFHKPLKGTLESLRDEVIISIDENNSDKVRLNSVLAIIDEGSNLDKLTSFSQTKRENEIYQDLLSEDNGENASELTELASERANDEFNDLISLVKEDAVTLHELV